MPNFLSHPDYSVPDAIKVVPAGNSTATMNFFGTHMLTHQSDGGKADRASYISMHSPDTYNTDGEEALEEHVYEAILEVDETLQQDKDKTMMAKKASRETTI